MFKITCRQRSFLSCVNRVLVFLSISSDNYAWTSLWMLEKIQNISSKSEFVSICTTGNWRIWASNSTNINKIIHLCDVHLSHHSSFIYLNNNKSKDHLCRSTFFDTICTLIFNTFRNSYMSMFENIDQLREVCSCRIHIPSNMQ